MSDFQVVLNSIGVAILVILVMMEIRDTKADNATEEDYEFDPAI